jgi:hypothetical protein
MRWQLFAVAPLLFVTVMLVVLAGCGSTSGYTGVASAGGASAGRTASPSTSPSADQDERRLQFTRCMREHGVDLPDPGPNGVPRPGLGSGAAALRDTDRQAFEDALDACRQYADGAVLHGGLSEQDKQQMLDFTTCLREQGVDIGDPDPATGVPPMEDLRKLRSDPDLEKALDACADRQPDLLGGDAG